MNTQFYIRYETVDGKSWSDALANLNVYTNAELIEDYSQQAQRYRRADYKMNIFKTVSDNPATFLSIGFPTNIPDQTVTISPVNTDLIISKLSTGKYLSLYFAFYFGDNPGGAGDLDVVTKSDYFARNTKTGKFENLTTGEVIDEQEPKFSFWYSVSKVGGSNIYYMVVNPEMTAVTYDITGTFKGVDYRLLDNHDGSFAQAVFSPSVQGGELVSENIIVANSDTVVIDTLGKSILHGFTGSKIPDAELPAMSLDIKTSIPYTVKNNLVTLDMSNKSVAYVKIKWITNSNLDFPMISGSEAVTENFVIIK